MTKIGAQSTTTGQTSASQTPWSDQAPAEVRGLRRAITEQMSQTKVGRDMAPMMSELLTRLDAVVGGESPTELAAPEPPGAAERPTLRQTASGLRRVSGKLAAVAADAGQSHQRQALAALADVVDRHVAMRQEVLMRADNV